jgi:hypothetical protein
MFFRMIVHECEKEEVTSMCPFLFRCVVGMQGFEPWTSRSRSVRATKLRYIPSHGGESGIRTHETLSRLLAFEASSFDHSDISPLMELYHKNLTVHIITRFFRYVNNK